MFVVVGHGTTGPLFSVMAAPAPLRWAVSAPRPCSARTDEPGLSLAPPAGPVSPLALGYPDTHRARAERRSSLGAIAARHTGGRDAARHGPQGSGGMSARTRHLWPGRTRLSSGDGRDVGHLPGTRRGLGRWPSSAGGACQQRDASVLPHV